MGTCAGAILLAREVLDPVQPSLGLLDAVVRRNAYGRQVDSFEASIEILGLETPLRAIFIRAPRFDRIGLGVEVLARHEGEPVLVLQRRILAGTFHPELTGDGRLHRRFIEIVEHARDADMSQETSACSHSARGATEVPISGPAAEPRRIGC